MGVAIFSVARARRVGAWTRTALDVGYGPVAAGMLPLIGIDGVGALGNPVEAV